MVLRSRSAIAVAFSRRDDVALTDSETAATSASSTVVELFPALAAYRVDQELAD